MFRAGDPAGPGSTPPADTSTTQFPALRPRLVGGHVVPPPLRAGDVLPEPTERDLAVIRGEDLGGNVHITHTNAGS